MIRKAETIAVTVLMVAVHCTLALGPGPWVTVQAPPAN